MIYIYNLFIKLNQIKYYKEKIRLKRTINVVVQQ